MSFFKEAGDSLVKYTEKLVNKTEEYAKVGKLTLDVKKLESTIDKINKEIGEYVINKINEGADTVSLSDEFIRDKTNAIKEANDTIISKRAEIEELKRNNPEESEQAQEQAQSAPSNDVSDNNNDNGNATPSPQEQQDS